MQAVSVPIPKNTVLTRLQDIQSQIIQSWPKRFHEIMAANPYSGYDEFFIYWVPKWDYRGTEVGYNMTYYVKQMCPDPFWGTTLLRVRKKDLTTEIWWTLPHREGADNFTKQTVFFDPLVAQFVEEKRAGTLDKLQEKCNNLLASGTYNMTRDEAIKGKV